jgi:hypothetical protein
MMVVIRVLAFSIGQARLEYITMDNISKTMLKFTNGSKITIK